SRKAVRPGSGRRAPSRAWRVQPHRGARARSGGWRSGGCARACAGLRSRARDGKVQLRRRPRLRGRGMTSLWRSVIAASPELATWLAKPAGRLRIGRLPRSAWPVVASAVARSVAAEGRPLLILVTAPDQFADALRPWLAGRPPVLVFAEVGVSFLDRPPAFDPSVNLRL